MKLRICLSILTLVLILSACGNEELPQKVIKLDEPFAEWSLNYSDYTGNPYDVMASAVFTHEETGETKRSLMFYDGNDTWKFRFTGTKTGRWQLQTDGPGPLGDQQGEVTVEDNSEKLPGFMTAEGRKWLWSGSREEIIPHFVMAARPASYWANDAVDSEAIRSTMQEFISETGFTGLHIPGVGGMWVNINQYSTRDDNDNPIGPQDPDTRTFLVLEEFIQQGYEHGALTHIWMWGADSHADSGPDGIGGAMSDSDKRILRYIAGRLGPIPGWSMGYGYDLHAWAEPDELQTWYDFLKHHLGGWNHMVGARADRYDANNQRMLQSDSLGLPRNPLSEIFWEGDYVGHYDYRVPYSWYVEILTGSDKPQFEEDRFRIREHRIFQNKDYTPEMTIRGMWHSTMAGGVANIWGNLLPGNSSSSEGSQPYDNQAGGEIKGNSFTVDIKDEINTYHTFWFKKGRFSYDLIRDNELTGNQTGEGFLHPKGGGWINVCLRDPEYNFYIFYAENTDELRMDLSNMNGEQNVFAVDTQKAYEEQATGSLDPELYDAYQLPYQSNWAVVVGNAGNNN